MTFTIMGRCSASGRFGLAMATSSLAVGGRCPSGRWRTGIVSSQSYTHPTLGLAAVELLALGATPREAIDSLAGFDQHFAFRQVGILTASGATAVHTGDRTRPWSGHLEGEHWIAMGNILVGREVLEAMNEAFENSGEEDLETRLLHSLAAGGEAGGEAVDLPERSAALIVYGDKPYPVVDLRVDVSDAAIDDLESAFAAFDGYAELYSDLRPSRPDLVPTEQEWISGRGIARG